MKDETQVCTDTGVTAKTGGLYYGWFLVVIVFIIYVMNAGLTLYGASTLNSIIVLEEGVSNSSLSTASTLHTAMTGAMGPVVGILIKKIGHKYMFAMGGVCALLGGLLYVLMPPAGWVMALGHGVFIALAVGFGSSLCTQSLTVQWFEKNQSLAMSLALSSGAVGGFIAPLIMEGLAESLGWRWGFGLMAVGGVVAIILSFLFVKDHPSEVGEVPRWPGFSGSGRSPGGQPGRGRQAGPPAQKRRPAFGL